MAEQTDTDSLNEDRLDKNISRNVPEIFNRSNDSPSREKDTSTETTITETDSDNDQGLDENTSTPENSNKNKNKRKRKNNNKNSTFTEDEDPSSDYEEDITNFRRITRSQSNARERVNYSTYIEGKDTSSDEEVGPTFRRITRSRANAGENASNFHMVTRSLGRTNVQEEKEDERDSTANINNGNSRKDNVLSR